jgi:hypothetical protein
VRIRLQPWQLAVLVVVLSIGCIAVVRWRKNSVPYDAAHMIATLPIERATLFYADVDALRTAGILDLVAGSKAAEEPDYRKFVEQTGFDYRTDLDSVAAAFAPSASYFTVHGRFQWKQLAAYAQSQGGECRYTICSLPGSTLERNISFYPLQPDVLALAVSSDINGVSMISPSPVLKLSVVAPEPLWITAAASVLTKPGSLPESVQALLGPVARADRITLAAGPQGTRAQLRLSVVCKSPDDAESVKSDLSSATEVLRNAISQDHSTPSQPDWAGMLRAGSFSRKGAEVTGVWPLDRSFLEALASPSVP